MKHRWLITCNLEKDINQPTGFLQFSACVFREDQPSAELVPETQQEELRGKASESLRISPNFKLSKKVLKISIYAIHRIVAMDTSFFSGSQSSDPYFVARIGKSKSKTRPLKNLQMGERPTMLYKVLNLSFADPSYEDTLSLCLKEWNQIESNQYFGTAYLKIQDIKNGKYETPFWLYFYGGQLNADNTKVKDVMNMYPDRASKFKGAVYIKVEQFGNLDYEERCESMSEKDSKEVIPPLQGYVLCLRAYSIMQFVYESSKNSIYHRISVNWGGKSVSTSQKLSKNDMCEFFESVILEESFSLPPRKQGEDQEAYDLRMLEHLPDVIISLENMSKQKHVSYLRIRPEDIYNPNLSYKKVKFEELKRDHSFEDLMPYGAGILGYRVNILSQRQADRVAGKLSQEKSFNVKRVPIKITLNAFQAKMLAASDENSLSDPLARFYHSGTSKVTQTMTCTLNPMWLYRDILESEMFKIDGEMYIPPVIVDVLDEDEEGLLFTSQEYEFLGRAFVPLSEEDISNSVDQVPAPTWRPLSIDGVYSYGKILFSCQIHDFKLSVPSPLCKIVKTSDVGDFLIKLKLLSLRNLVTDSFMGITQAKIVLDASALLSFGKGDNFSKLTCKCRENGANPTIGQVMK